MSNRLDFILMRRNSSTCISPAVLTKYHIQVYYLLRRLQYPPHTFLYRLTTTSQCLNFKINSKQAMTFRRNKTLSPFNCRDNVRLRNGIRCHVTYTRHKQINDLRHVRRSESREQVISTPTYYLYLRLSGTVHTRNKV